MGGIDPECSPARTAGRCDGRVRAGERSGSRGAGGRETPASHSLNRLGRLSGYVNPYGRFELDMNSHLALAAAASMAPGPRTAPEAEDARSAAEGAVGATSPGAGQLADRSHGSSGS
jgi:hypothetical protein